MRWTRATSVLILSLSGLAFAQTEAPPGDLAAELTRLKVQVDQQQTDLHLTPG